VAFAIGAIVFAIGTSLSRASRREAALLPSWTIAVSGDDPLTPDERIELLERLTIVDQPWCAELIEAAAQQERDPRVRRVAKRSRLGKIRA